MIAVASWLAVAGPLSAEPAPAASTASAPAPLTLKDLLAPADLTLPRLAPSGRALAMVRRVGDIDQVVRVDLPDMKTTAVFQTGRLTPELVKQKFRQSIDYLQWKSDDRLVVSMSTPVSFELGYASFRLAEPVHLIIDATGKSPPLYLNARTHNAKPSAVELSWIQSLLKDDPGHVMIGYHKTLQSVEVDRVAVADGGREVLERGGEDVVGYGTDRAGAIVTRTLQRDDGSLILQGRPPGQTAWTRIFEFRRKDERALAKFDFLGVGEPGVIYVAAKPETPADGDTTAVRTFDLRNMKIGPVVWSNPTYDVESIVQDEDSGAFVAGCYWVDVLQCDFKSPKLTSHFKGLGKFFEGKRSLAVISQSRDGQMWILLASGPDEPASYFVYDVAAHHLQALGPLQSGLTSERLGPMRRMDFKARDGAALWAYVTDPPGAPPGPLPLVVLPHGGPEARDGYAYDTLTQFLAIQGYRVLQPMFRGSGGLGRAFATAGYGQWGGRMHDDVMDATRALLARGGVDARRVCVVGASYGGYEALYAAGAEPAMFTCAASIDGVSDLVEDMKWERHFGRDSERFLYWRKSEGDPEVDHDRLAAKSPISRARDWSTPLLLVHGDKDDIVPVDQSRRMQRALQAAGKPVEYLEVKGMGHGPSTDEEATKVYDALAAFLGRHLKADAAPKRVPAKAG